jgi:hypothetical protein
MKNIIILLALLLISIWSIPVFSQAEKESETLGLPGDNLDLYAVLDLFQKSKTIEDFEKSLNDEKTGINNLDLNLDDKVDFLKVVTKQDGKDFTFVLQDAVNEKETQDVAVILVSKDKENKVTMQIVGDKDLYGKDYVIEPKAAAPASTANPGYTGANPVTESVPASTTVVVVESTPIVQYVYSPVYVPYVPPYYYGYYPPYYNPLVVPIAIGIYHSNHYPYHGGYNHGNTVVIHNTNNYNNYNNSRNSSTTVNHNNNSGNYNSNNNNRPSNTSGNNASKPSNTSVNNASRPSNTSGNNAAKTSATSGSKPSTSQSTAPRSSSSASSVSNPSQSSASRSSATSGSSGSRSSASSYSGGGGSRGGGGGRRR